MKKIERGKSVGLIGLGYWGKNIMRNLNELGVLHTACDLDSDIIVQRRDKVLDVEFVKSYEDVFLNPQIKSVAIATPAATHYELARKALLSGKDVFVEKPLALTIKEGEELVSLAGRSGKILMVGHILLYHQAIIKLKELISNGELGKIRYIYSNRLNIGKLRTEENILWSFAPHDISVILFLIGDEPSAVSSFGEFYLNKGIYDTTMTTMTFSNEIKGHIFVSWLHPFKEQKLVVIGSKAMAVFDDLTDEKLFVYPHTIDWKNGKVPVAHKADYIVIPLEKAEPLKRELEHFINCTSDRKCPVTDGHEGLRVLRVLQQAEDALITASATENAAKARRVATSSIFIHDSSYVDENVEIGEGTKIWHYSHILSSSIIGKNCVIGQNVVVGPDVTIGDGCKIQNNVSIYKGVKLEGGVFCGPSCVFTNVYNPRAFIERKHEFKETIVKKGATIGANATVVCGNNIGRYAMIGAGSVVKAEIPDNAIVAGVPAKQIGWACRCGTTLEFKNKRAVCKYCNNKYRLKEKNIIKE